VGRVAKGKREPARVVIDQRASDFATVIEVHAADRVGLLYDVAAALTQLRLDIRIARVATYGQDVVDTFYIRDSEGQKVSPDEESRVRKQIMGRIAGAT